MTLDEQIEQDRRAGFRPGVGIALMHHGQLLLGRQGGGFSRLGRGPSGESVILPPQPEWMLGWEIPQGGIEVGESLVDAFWRECEEELDDWFDAVTQPKFFRREQMEFPVNKDGRRYRGKTYYFCVVHVGLLCLGYEDWVYGPNGDDSYPTPFPVRGFPGGVLFCNYEDARQRICASQTGRKAALSLGVLDDLLQCEEIRECGGALSAMDLESARSLPATDGCSLTSFIERARQQRTA